ncbi:NOP5/NOP56 family protein [Candidatus Altiarchaeota archaeon]
MRLETNVIGTFLVKDGRVIEKILFDRDPVKIASLISATSEGVSDVEEELLTKYKGTGGKSLFVKNPKRFWGRGYDIEFIADSKKIDLYSIAEEVGMGRREVDELLSEVNTLLTFESARQIEDDFGLMQAIASLDDLENVVNKLVERLREWYSIHFPELDLNVEDHETYARLVSKLGFRKNFSQGKTGLDPRHEEVIIKHSHNSMGAKIDDAEIKPIKQLADRIISVYDTGKMIEEYVNDRMTEVAPNISALAGPLLGARLITLAGGLNRLSILPAGTIQVLGAEDAFFRFLKTGKRPPKHGVIFTCPEIRQAPKSKRGKLSRTLAAKIALASRADMYKGPLIGPRLKKEFLARVKAL